ncbi:B3 domain-containing transcription factor LEC2 [Alnus glutinosa]|uniref:B3 domain-containing transcription factor LEC2 n=1 Tax=Alnus glutinosa TaxID=3517 RepID=UPI002D774E53|nr:B3 domain-containing transcription factor LEC2 [Alnus glutinosa]
MDSFFTPIIPTDETTTMSFPSSSSTSQYYFPPHHEGLQLPYAFPLEQAGQRLVYPAYPFVMGVNPQPHLLSKEHERRLVDAWTTKIARIKRKIARQRSLGLNRNSASWPSSTQVHTQELQADVQNSNNVVNRDPYTFWTPDKKRLRVLLKKELKNSDVGSLGRIVLPKREAEENLPILSDKDGIQIVIRDVFSNKQWGMKYKYWINNKSRMYVLENAVDFVKQNGLVIGDSITLYEDECKNLYVSIEKVERAVDHEASSYRQHCTNHSSNSNNLYIPFTYEARDEEEASLALLIEQLRPKEEAVEANSLATLSMGAASSHRPHLV